jgi:hypothetical protein
MVKSGANSMLIAGVVFISLPLLFGPNAMEAYVPDWGGILHFPIDLLDHIRHRIVPDRYFG